MTANREEVETRLKRVLLETLNEPPEAVALGADVALIGSGLALDSIALLELVIGLENEFEIVLDETKLRAEDFASISTLVDYIASMLPPADASRVAVRG
jgi:acyl carrier protein